MTKPLDRQSEPAGPWIIRVENDDWPENRGVVAVVGPFTSQDDAQQCLRKSGYEHRRNHGWSKNPRVEDGMLVCDYWAAITHMDEVLP